MIVVFALGTGTTDSKGIVRCQITTASRFAVREALKVVAVAAATAPSELLAASLRAVPEVARNRGIAVSHFWLQAAGASTKDRRDQ